MLKAVNKWVDRLPLWKLAVLNASAIILILTIMSSYVYVNDRQYWLGIRWCVAHGVFWTILFTGSSTLSAYIGRRRRGKRGSTGPGR
jgi:threonine/homoserine/homoserine lactone efflux protein